MSEKGVEAAHSAFLLSGLPDTFDEWKTHHGGSKGLQQRFERRSSE
jgi:hypothetical protein